jgi:hypothetical protein
MAIERLEPRKFGPCNRQKDVHMAVGSVANMRHIGALHCGWVLSLIMAMPPERLICRTCVPQRQVGGCLVATKILRDRQLPSYASRSRFYYDPR